MLKKILKMSLVALALVFACVQFVRPSRFNPPAQAGRGIEEHLNVTPAVGTILKRSCMDCHSNRTEWPWYSNVAPTSWLVADHVNQGRRYLNFSDWARMNRGEAEDMLKFMCMKAQRGSMPMPSYTLVHRGAKLSDADIGTLCDWADAESERLAAKAAPEARILSSSVVE